MPIHGLDHFNLRASAALIATLKDFYVRTLGLQEGPRPPFDSHGYWLYAGGQALVHLSVASDGEQREPHRHNTVHHIALACSDRPALEQQLTQCGVPFQRSIVPGTGIHQLFFQDPAGNGVELSFPPEH